MVFAGVSTGKLQIRMLWLSSFSIGQFDWLGFLSIVCELSTKIGTVCDPSECADASKVATRCRSDACGSYYIYYCYSEISAIHVTLLLFQNEKLNMKLQNKNWRYYIKWTRLYLLISGFFLFGATSKRIWAASWQNRQNDSAPSEDSDQPGHPPSLIRVFTVRMKKAWVLSYPLSAQQRLCALSLRWAHSHIVGFVTRRLIWIFKDKIQTKSQRFSLFEGLNLHVWRITNGTILRSLFSWDGSMIYGNGHELDSNFNRSK